MASVCFYFQVHQPHRLRQYTVFDSDPFYFHDAKNREIAEKVASKCYRPTTSLILELVKRHKGNFRVSYAITGTALDQFEHFTPDVIDLFKRLGDTGCCEFIGETYYHSLSFLYSQAEFESQVEMHTQRIHDLFGQRPTVFRDTELIYANDLARALSRMKDKDGNGRWHGTICEGTDWHLGFRSPNYVYKPPPGDDGKDLVGRDGRAFGLLLKNYRLSDDIAFRFSNRGWAEWPLSAEKFAGWVNQINGDGYLCNLFMDYETFGEHQWADTGIFQFLDKLPEAVFDVAKKGDGSTENHFITPSMALKQFPPVGVYDVPQYISWADMERDLTAWRGNAMQDNALAECYALEEKIKRKLADAERSGDETEIEHAGHILNDWRKLTTSDHFYYMCTKFWSDGDVHKYFSPYDSPYDSYINYMNVLDNVRTRVSQSAKEALAKKYG
ncbi:MAG: glycoside hydrolase family 57 protein [Phycisphaerales bacterium]|jgi:alpha-amylase|nr:glycoside hydrolase family 57 protein [Phycisphaerales bacterium]